MDASLARVLEPEVMDSPGDAADYDAMDHAEVNRVFVEDFLAALAEGTAGGAGGGGAAFEQRLAGVLDVGTGTAQIPVALCRRAAQARVLAVDLAASMLELARRNVVAAGLAERIRLEQIDAKGLPYADGSFPAVMSNSIVHHIPEPAAALREMLRVTGAGGLVFVRDLARPSDEAELQRLVEIYAAGTNPHQRQLFADSLRAALTVEEVQAIVGRESVRMTSDRHWTWVGRKNAEC